MTEEQRQPTEPASVDVLVESPLWENLPEIEPLVRRVVAAALPAEQCNCALAVVLTDDRAMRALNARFRGRDAPTNVLSFPAPPAPRLAASKQSGEPSLLGDIVIAFETAKAEADAEGKELVHHTAHLLVHGVLHLLGYDHQSEAEADAMEARERAILMRLDMPDPYEARERA
jgi:probable rRNA maturation factor